VTQEETIGTLRSKWVARLGLDLRRRVRSAQVQRRFQSAGHEVSVARLEVFERVYMPVNVYAPRRRHAITPVVVAPLGCGWRCGSPEAQTLAANLAEMGMVVLVAEGFCHNGARAGLPDGNPLIGYAREFLGLSSTTAVFLQELVSSLTWVLDSFPFTSPDQVGVAGHSYGGGTGQLFAALDERVRSVSLPATSVGEPCDARPLAVSDIHLQTGSSSDVVWSAPLEVPLLPRNARLLLLYPRFVHTTTGSRDSAARPDVVAGAMRYAGDIWAVAGLRDRVLFQTDDGDHNYGRSRREDTYEWFARSLLGERPARIIERSIPLRPSEDMEPDLAGTRTFTDEMRLLARAERARRFAGPTPTPDAAQRARQSAQELFGERRVYLKPERAWRGSIAGRSARAWRYVGDTFDVPVVEFEGGGPADSGTLLFLPERGVADALAVLRERAEHFERVVSLDYLGIGELESDRVLLHTLGWRLMHAQESLPSLNIGLIRGVLQWLGHAPATVEGQGWASSMYAGVLRALEPGRIRGVQVSGVPDDELRWLQKGRRVPDLLLHPALFRRLTVAELAD
jgi:hypothetical protein